MSKNPHYLLIPFIASLLWPISGQAQEVDALDVVKQCYYKNWGEDQHTNLIFTMRNKAGVVTKRRTYRRFWKDYRGDGDLVSKLMLFTTGPPEFLGNNFLRVTYTLESQKPREAWIFLRKLQSVQRVSVREESNLNWGLNSEDLTIRQINEDTHSLLGIDQKGDKIAYRIKSVPTFPNSIYGNIISTFEKQDSWDDCAMSTREYYDKKGGLIKKVSYTWQQVDDAWVSDTIVITIDKVDDKKFPEKKKLHKETDFIIITYQFTEPHVNIGLKDKDFTTRSLRRRAR